MLRMGNLERKEIKTSSEINVHNMSRIQLWPAAKIAPPRKKRERKKKILPPTCSPASIRVIYNNIGDDFITLPTQTHAHIHPLFVCLSLSLLLTIYNLSREHLCASHFETIHLALQKCVKLCSQCLLVFLQLRPVV